MNKRRIRKIQNNVKQVATMGKRASNAMMYAGEGATMMGQPEIGVSLMAAGQFAKKGSKLLKKAGKGKK
jgi:hypothetical protein